MPYQTLCRCQLGGVRIGDDVEIGANTTIDRGALEDTDIGDGVKLDNQIMLGHNVRIGAHTAMAACVGVAGSRSEEHTSELQSLMRNSYADFCLKIKNKVQV